MDEEYDISVLGLGGMGAFALEYAASQGYKTIGIEQYIPPHNMGSTHGQWRLLREAYSEGAVYIPFLRRSVALWREINKKLNQDVFFETGVEYFGPKNNPHILSTRQSADQYNIALNEADSNPVQIKVDADWDHFYEVNAGYLNVENTMKSILSLAQEYGAKCLSSTQFQKASFNGDKWMIETNRGSFTSRYLIYTLGSRTHEYLPFLKPFLELERHTQHWFEDKYGYYQNSSGFRPFVGHLPNGKWFYGFPANKEGLVKIAEHNTGSRFKLWERMDRKIYDDDYYDIQEFCANYMPNIGKHSYASACMYTMSPDGDFLIDFLPDNKKSVFAAGLSGHGYKFAPAIGEALVNMVVREEKPKEIASFDFGRFKSVRSL